jgi:hypothetical protein
MAMARKNTENRAFSINFLLQNSDLSHETLKVRLYCVQRIMQAFRENFLSRHIQRHDKMGKVGAGGGSGSSPESTFSFSAFFTSP